MSNCVVAVENLRSERDKIGRLPEIATNICSFLHPLLKFSSATTQFYRGMEEENMKD